MIGIDLVEIDRIKDIYLKHGNLFIEKILNPKERDELPKEHNVSFFGVLSCFIASKEAIFKACSIENLDWKEISIQNLQKRPSVRIQREKFYKKILLTHTIGKNIVLSQAIAHRI